jgi:uncharacterized protein (DUF2252 family)
MQFLKDHVSKKPRRRMKVRSSQDRKEVLAERRNLKMARSAHAYVRGNTSKFYDWLDSAPGAAVPQGPPVWICGDCHVGNLGPIGNAKGRTDIQIRDLDQTVIGNPAHDLIRLGLSLASAARGSDLPGVMTAKMLEQMIEGYEQAFADIEEETVTKVEKPEAVKIALKNALNRKWRDLAKERIENQKPTIPLGKRFWSLSRQEREEIESLFADEKIRRLVTSLRSRDDHAAVKVQDAAFWVKGCSSLGRLRYAVLLSIGGDDGELCLIDVKEAVPACAPRYPKVKMPKNNAERVVAGAWHLSPALGERMLPATLQERPVFLRELLPQDLKFEIESLTPPEAMKVAKFLAMVVGKAHARQMDAEARQGWQKELIGNRSKTLDAPSWLWSSVVELMVSHEGAYLEHCRKYASTMAN